MDISHVFLHHNREDIEQYTYIRMYIRMTLCTYVCSLLFTVCSDIVTLFEILVHNMSSSVASVPLVTSLDK